MTIAVILTAGEITNQRLMIYDLDRLRCTC